METGNLLVQMLGQHIDLVFVLAGVLPQFDLGQHLVGEGVGHHKAGMAGGAAQVDQAAFRQEDDALAVGEDDVVHLGLDVVPGILAQRGDIDFIVEVADVADDGLALHLRHMFVIDDMVVAGGGDEDIPLVTGIVHGDYSVTFHGCLQGADGIDLGDPDRSTLAAQ